MNQRQFTRGTRIEWGAVARDAVAFVVGVSVVAWGLVRLWG